jgi:hypothetical protein
MSKYRFPPSGVLVADEGGNFRWAELFDRHWIVPDVFPDVLDENNGNWWHPAATRHVQYFIGVSRAYQAMAHGGKNLRTNLRKRRRV